MLTGDLVRPRLRRRDGRIWVEHAPLDDPTWQRTAADLIDLYTQHIGHSRGTLDDALTAYEGDRTDYEVVRGFAKVLSDAATFEPPPTPVGPANLRAQLFTQGPAFAESSLFRPHTRASLLEEAAAEHNTTPAALEAALFADLPAANLLTTLGKEWDAPTLIARYNVELARGVLYWASEMRVEIYDHFKEFWQYVKLFKLMFSATPIEGGYAVTLDGPISPFVHSTTRYGRQMAAFLPALLFGERWQMAADIRMFDSELLYTLDHNAPLTSIFKRSGRFDSRLEADFAVEFHAKFGDERGKWRLNREDEVLLLGDSVFIPDFSIEHKEDGRRALVEIMGFWHPEYLKRKLRKVRAANRDNLILLVYEGVNLTPDRLQNVPADVLYFVNKPILKHVMAAVERIAT